MSFGATAKRTQVAPQPQTLSDLTILPPTTTRRCVEPGRPLTLSRIDSLLLVAFVVEMATKRLPTLCMITTFAPIDVVGSATASVTLPPLRVAAAVACVTAAGGTALGAVPPLGVAEAVGVVSAGAVGVASTGTAGVTAADATDAELVPAAFVAVTVNVYDLPFVSPLIEQLVAGVVGATVATEQFSPVPAVAV